MTNSAVEAMTHQHSLAVRRRHWLAATLLNSVVGAVLIVFALSRVATTTPDGGDIAVWVGVHEWIMRGEHLYAGIWDHKDPGFFLMGALPYRLFGVLGLYLLAALMLVVFAVAVYTIAHRALSRSRALLVTMLVTATYVAAPTFLSTYTEAMSISVAALGLALFRQQPLLSGLLFGVAAYIKVGAGLLWVTLVIYVAVAILARKVNSSLLRRCNVSIRELSANALGFVLAMLMLTLLAVAVVDLQGWFDAISYNREYQSLRGFPPSGGIFQTVPESFQLWSQDLGRLSTPVFGYLFWLTVSIIFTTGVYSRASRRPYENLPSLKLDCDFQVTAVFAVASVALTLSQRPSEHHWQFAVGGALLFGTILMSRLLGYFRYSATRLLGVWVVASITLVTTLVMNPTLLARGALSGLENWTTTSTQGALGNELARAPEGLSLAYFGGNSVRPEFEQLPDSVSLACPYIYQFEHLFPRYEDRYIECIDDRPDIILLDTSVAWGTQEFRKRVATVLRSEYVECTVEDIRISFWAKSDAICLDTGRQKDGDLSVHKG